MSNKELEQKFGDGVTRIVGTTDYEEAYYSLGEKGAIGDLGSVGAPFTILKFGMTYKEDDVNTAYIKSFLRILAMIAERTDGNYLPTTRQIVREILEPYKSAIDLALNTTIINTEQARTLLPIRLAWDSFALTQMK